MTSLLMLIESTRQRAEMGRAKYGVYLTARNGRNPLVDAFQESLDQMVYLRQAIEDGDAMPPIHPDYATRPEPAPIYNPDLDPIFLLVIADLEAMAINNATCETYYIGSLRLGYYASNLHYLYYSAIQVALRIQYEIRHRIAEQEPTDAKQEPTA